eukprot:4578016-Amphidinium_carterae.1
MPLTGACHLFAASSHWMLYWPTLRTANEGLHVTRACSSAQQKPVHGVVRPSEKRTLSSSQPQVVPQTILSGRVSPSPQLARILICQEETLERDGVLGIAVRRYHNRRLVELTMLLTSIFPALLAYDLR